MARKKAPSLGKIRTREHIIADLGVNHVERQVYLCGFTVERIIRDYGLDLILFTYTEAGELEDGGIFLQVKATEELTFLKRENCAAFRVARSDVRSWLSRITPVILAVHDISREQTFWIHVQAYFEALPGFNRFLNSGTMTVHLPPQQTLTPDAVRQIAKVKNQLFQR